MPCAGPNYSCNSLLSISSPLGEIWLGAPGSLKPAPGPLWPLIKTYRASREALAHRRQRRDLARLDQRLLKDIGLSRTDAKADPRLLRLLYVLRAAAEWIARKRLRYAVRELDRRRLDEIAASDTEEARELRKLFGLRGVARGA
jgi:uncharacterized protein YjiS (DUF1127 family)